MIFKGGDNLKQNITKQDLLELNDKQIKALFSYWWETPPVKKNPNTPYARCEYDTGYLLDLPMLSIEDMIEYLQQLNLPLKFVLNLKPNGKWYVENYYGFSEQEELCDCLWELTKKVLNK